MATSYFRERARNPYLRSQVAPIFEEDPNISPTFSQPMPTMTPTIEASPTRAVAPTPYVDPIETARTAYEAQVPTTTKGRILEAIKSAGLGFLQAASRDRENPIAAGIGGAATGGAISAISPKTGRAYQFETFERPGIEERLRREEEHRKRQQAEEDRARAITMDELKRREGEAGIANTEAQTRARRYETVPL